MKRSIIILIVVSMILSAITAKESVLIDFAALVSDESGEHAATLMDYSGEAGTRFSDEEKAGMNTSLYLENWEVVLSSSSQSVTNIQLSQVVDAQNNANATDFPGEHFLGVRVHYPEGSFNSYAWVKPPFDIPAYATHPTDADAIRGSQFNGFGVVKNVGVIKNLKVNVYGMNYPMKLLVILRDENEEETVIPFAFLDFDGWKQLVWENPNYITDVRNREMNKQPLYPRSSPSYTLDSIAFYRDAMIEGGDFITYIKDVTITYDLAELEGVEVDFDHEQIWGILAEREAERRKAEMERLGNVQVLRYIETMKMHEDPVDETLPATP